MTIKTSLRYLTTLSFLAGVFLLTLFSFTSVAEAATATGATVYTGWCSGPGSCAVANNFSVIGTITGPDTVAPGATLTLTGLVSCVGDDFSPNSSLEVIVNPGSNSFPMTASGNCGSFSGTSVGTLDIPIPAGATPGTYTLNVTALVVGGLTSHIVEEAVPGVYTYEVVTSNNVPTAPTITPLGTNNNLTGVPQSFTFLATDPDGDQIRYQIDWDNNGTVDTNLPGATTFVNSGVSQTGSYTWTSAGTSTFRARVVDDKDEPGPWTSHDVTITTPPTPTVTTDPAINITGTTATLRATVNPNGLSTTGWFRYSTVDPGACNATFGTRVPAVGGVSLGSGTTNVTLSQDLTGLTTGTTYYVCAFASNPTPVGTTIGGKISFATHQPRLMVCPVLPAVGIDLTRDLIALHWPSLASIPNCSTPGANDETTNAGTNWSSSDTSLATVDNLTNKGRVTGVAPGLPNISATYSGLSATSSLRVLATPVLFATAGSCDTGVIDLSWSAIAGATSYDLEINGTSINVPSNAYAHTGLVADSSHNYQVRAGNAGGFGAWSSLVSATAPAACSDPTPPLGTESCILGPLLTETLSSDSTDPSCAGLTDYYDWYGGSPVASCPFGNNTGDIVVLPSGKTRCELFSATSLGCAVEVTYRDCTPVVPPSPNYDLTITMEGEPASIGTVNLTLGALIDSCNTDCTRTYPAGIVSITASITDGNAIFDGPSGCSGSNCLVSMADSPSVIVTFVCNEPTYIWNGTSCGATPVDLAASTPLTNEIGATIVNSGIDGTYNNVTTRFTINNVGGEALPASSAISYRAELNGTILSTIDTFDGPIAPLGNSSMLNRVFDGVVGFGPHTVCAIVNLDGSPNYPESPGALDNNTNCNNFSLPVPRPPMDISSTDHFIRAGESANITWSIQTGYAVNCSVSGPGLTESFTLPAVGGIYTSSSNSSLKNTGTFRLRCVEPGTGESHEDRVTVEVIPNYQEI